MVKRSEGVSAPPAPPAPKRPTGKLAFAYATITSLNEKLESLQAELAARDGQLRRQQTECRQLTGDRDLLLDALWTAREHALLWFGENHNVVGRADEALRGRKPRGGGVRIVDKAPKADPLADLDQAGLEITLATEAFKQFGSGPHTLTCVLDLMKPDTIYGFNFLRKALAMAFQAGKDAR